MDDVQAIIDEDKALRAAFAPEDEELIPDDNDKGPEDHHDIAEELLSGEGEAFQEKFVEMENMDWDDGAERRRRCLDDMPHCPVVRGRAKKARTNRTTEEAHDEGPNETEPEEREVFFGKVASTQASREKQMESEIPWSSIDPGDRPAFEAAEAKQWNEHLKFAAVRVLSKEETEQVYAEIPAERILTSRFAYKDKARAQRALNPEVPVKAKARLCVGGHRGPDLGTRPLSVDAPTASKDSLMLGMQCAVSLRWSASIGDVQAAFLNGVAAPRGLYFKQPPRGLPGVEEGVLVEIIKGVFGLATSPRLWFEKLVQDIGKAKVELEEETLHFEQNDIDPCVFHLVDQQGNTRGLLETHVDDLLLLTEERLKKATQAKLSQVFPISEWEDDAFKYVGSNYKKDGEGYLITQEDYVEERLKYIDVPKGSNQDPVDERLFHDNRTAVGCLSWLAKESRPDLACAANFAQARQGCPTMVDVKDTNKAIKQAKDYKEHGIKIRPIPLNEMCLVVYHDAAWGNSEPDDDAVEHLAGHRVGSQIGYLVLAVHNNGIGGKPSEMSTLAWKSHSCKRVCRSTFAGETMACCEGVECAIHLRGRLLSLMKRRLVKEPEAAALMPIHAVTDCKSLYDFVHRCGTPKPTADKRLIIDLASLKQVFLNEAKGWWKRERGEDVPAVDDPLLIPFHWVPSGHQLSDIMTKQMRPEAWWAAVTCDFFLAVSRQHKREV